MFIGIGSSVLPSSVLNFSNVQVAPSQVTGVISKIGSTDIYLEWVAPFNGGSTITDYKVEYKLTSEPTVWTTFTDGVSANLFATVTGLTTNSSYDFRISAINSVGTGAVSATLTVSTDTYMADHFDNSIVGLYHGASGVSATGNDLDAWADRAGYGGDMTALTTTRPVTGLTNVNSVNAVDFTSDDKISHPDSFELLPQGDFTLIFLFKLDARLDQQQSLIESSSGDFLVLLRGDGSQDILAKCGTGSASIAGALNTNTNILVVKREGSTITTYLNGTATASGVANNVTITWAITGQVNQWFGQFDGLLPFMSGYNKGLSSAEINTRCNSIATEFAGSWTNI